MQSTTLKKSTETLYEIKAPLASFDTIDLDDFELSHAYTNNSLKQPSPEKCAAELSDSLKEDLAEESKYSNINEKYQGTSSHSESYTEPSTPTPIETTFENDFNIVGTSVFESSSGGDRNNSTSANKVTAETSKDEIRNESEDDNETNGMTESGNITPTEASTGSRDANSSENNASAEEIQCKLKQKGRKHKEKASNVKYQQIDSLSDVSDQEKESPVPAIKTKSQLKDCDSDSESTDSDSGYIRSGYLSASKGFFQKGAKSPSGNKTFNIIGDFVDSDTAPYTSPKPRRPTLPPPLSKEESAIISKRKAYEKRLQRLQVTTNPIERPRSTTPINVYGLEEYIHISSPEKSPGNLSNLQKLKITLPAEEGSKGKSPRRSAKLSGHRPVEGGEPHVFTFNEDLLFTHTKSAILLEDDLSKGFSPKRVLVPPTLSPKVSPRNLPSKVAESQESVQYMYNPWEGCPDTVTSNKEQLNDIVSTAELDNWADFDNSKQSSASSEIITSQSSAVSGDDNIESGLDLVDTVDFPGEEILTVQIDEIGDSRKCDIKCEQVDINRTDIQEQASPHNGGIETVDCDSVNVDNESSPRTDICTSNAEEDLGTPV